LLLSTHGLKVSEVAVQMRARHAGASTLTLPRALLALSRAALAMVVVPLRAREAGDD
jgi:hypothetical protein